MITIDIKGNQYTFDFSQLCQIIIIIIRIIIIITHTAKVKITTIITIKIKANIIKKVAINYNIRKTIILIPKMQCHGKIKDRNGLILIKI